MLMTVLCSNRVQLSLVKVDV